MAKLTAKIPSSKNAILNMDAPWTKDAPLESNVVK